MAGFQEGGGLKNPVVMWFLFMLFAVLFLFVYCVSLSVLRSDSVPVSVPVAIPDSCVDLSKFSLGELFAVSESLGCGGSRVVCLAARSRRVRVSVGVVVRGRSGRRVGGAARCARLRRLVGRRWAGERLIVRSVSEFMAAFRAQVALQRVG